MSADAIDPKLDTAPFPPASEELRSARVTHLKHLSQNECDEIRAAVHGMLRDDSVAEDAFAHAMLAAVDKYDGSIPLRNYCLIVAKNFAISQYRRASNHDVSLDELENDEGEINHPAIAIGPMDVHDPYDLAEYEFLSNVLLGLTAEGNADERRTGRRAHAVLQRFLQSVRADEGIGVSEYDGSDAMSANKRGVLNRHIMQFLSGIEDGPIGFKTVEATMTTLRQATMAYARTSKARAWAEDFCE